MGPSRSGFEVALRPWPLQENEEARTSRDSFDAEYRLILSPKLKRELS